MSSAIDFCKAVCFWMPSCRDCCCSKSVEDLSAADRSVQAKKEPGIDESLLHTDATRQAEVLRGKLESPVKGDTT